MHVGVQTYAPHPPPPNYMFNVPYGRDGRPRKSLRPLDLSVGAEIKLTAGPGKGFVGRVLQTPGPRNQLTYTVELPSTREGASLGKGKQVYALGSWMIEEACAGKLHLLPVVNPFKP